MLYEDTRHHEANDQEKTDSSGLKNAAKEYAKEKMNNNAEHGNVKNAEYADAAKETANQQATEQSANAMRQEIAKNASRKAKEEGAKALAKAGAEGAAATGAAREGVKAAGEAAKAGAEGAASTGGAATSAAGATATAGVTLIVELILHAVKKTKNEIKSVGELGTAESDYKPSFSLIAPLIVIILFLFIFGAEYNHNFSASGVWGYSENEYAEKFEEDIPFSIKKSEFVDEDGYFDRKAYLKEASLIYKQAISESMEEAICHDLIETVKNYRNMSFGRWWNDYNAEKTLDTLRSNPWPYDLALDESGEMPLVGDVINYFASSTHDITAKSGYGTYEPTYNDVNFAEVISIMCMNPKFDLTQITYNEFVNYLKSEETRKFYYEIQVDWIAVFQGKRYDSTGLVTTVETSRAVGSEAEIAELDNKLTEDGITYTFKEYYANITLKPFGLRELFLLAQVEPFDFPPEDDMHFHKITWYEQLDRMEERIRFGNSDESKSVLGPSYDTERDRLSTIYEDLAAAYGEATGRSAWYYIGEPANLDSLRDELTGAILEGLTPDEIRAKFNFPEGTNVLDMMDYYLNQLMLKDYNRGNSGFNMNNYGCWDCVTMMITQYFTGQAMTDADIESFCRNYVSINGGCQYGQWYKEKGISFSDLQAFNADAIISQINQGNPVHLRIGGHWEYEGRTLHNTLNQHSIVVSGYDEASQSFIVLDPANSTNTQQGIPYDAFVNGTGLTTLQYQTFSYN